MATGLDLYTYRNAGTYNSPTWTLLSNIHDEKLGGDTNKVDGSSRSSRYKQNERGLKDFAASFSYVKKSTDTANYEALRDAWLNDTNLDMAFADGPIATTGTKYVRIQVGLFKWEEGRNLEDAIAADIELGLIDGITHPPAYTTVP